MEKVWNLIVTIANEDYMFVVYGILVLHVYKWFIFVGQVQKNKLKWWSVLKFWLLEWDDIGKSLVWAGVAIALDDIFLNEYNDWAEVDIQQLNREMYFIGGFFIDTIRKAITARAGFKPPKIDIDLYR